jgi:hypothetical protein
VYEGRVPFVQILRAWSDQAQVSLLVTLALFAGMEWNLVVVLYPVLRRIDLQIAFLLFSQLLVA